MPKLAFSPKRHGYHFGNRFTNRILPGVLNGVQTKGLCGGMSMSVIDYWRAGVPIPTHTPDELPPDPASGNQPLPLEASRLRTYIYDRQMNSLLTRLMFTRWAVAPWITPNDFHNWAIGSELQLVAGQIAMGRTALLGLWDFDRNPTKGHQVVCYGYETNPPLLYIYDPNYPNEDCQLVPVSPANGLEVRIGGSTVDRYRGYFWTDVYNWAENPPYQPPYKDLVVWNGITLQPSGNADVGGQIRFSATVRNVGDYPCRFQNLFVWVRGPNGENLDDLLGGAESQLTLLQPGQERLITRTAAVFGSRPGRYTVGLSYLSTQGEWLNLTAGTVGAQAQQSITLWQPKRLVVDQTISVPENSSLVSTGIRCQPGDEIAFTASGMIWSGVWLTGLNGPEGWLQRIETNPNSPYTNQPDAHPFSLIGRYGNNRYFYIGAGRARAAFRNATPDELLLRINDDRPGNGSGAFQCHVQVWR